MRRLMLLFTLLALTGCSAIVGGDLDPLEIDPSTRRTVSLSLRGFGPHVMQPVHVEFVRTDENRVQAAALFDPLGAADIDLVMPFGATVNATQVDFYADQLDDGLDIAGDHTWRRELDESGFLRFAHEFNFEDLTMNRPIGQGQDLQIAITGMEEHDTRTVILSLFQTLPLNPGGEDEMIEDIVTGVYRGVVTAGALGGLRGPMTDRPTVLRGVVDGGAPHLVELNIANGMSRCRLEVPTLPAEPLVLDMDFGDFECDDGEPLAVFGEPDRP